MKQIIKKLAIVLSVALVCAPMGAMAANKLIVKDATGVIDKMVVDDRGYIGIGVSTPIMPFQISISGTYIDSTFEVRNTGNPTYYSKYTAPVFQLMRNNLPTDNSGVVKDTDRFGYVGFGTYFGTTAKYGAAISSYSEGATASSTSVPGYLTFETTSTGAGSPSEKLRVTSAGNVGIGTQTPMQKLEVNGGIRLNAAASRPTCDATTRGTIWFNKAASLSADWLSVCTKNASDIYIWRTATLN